MHKWIILLVKWDDKSIALDNAKDFLEQYWDGRVWDWYQVWGRWSWQLSPITKDFLEQAKKLFDEKEPERRWTTTTLIDSLKKELEDAWLSLWGEWPNPYSNHYDLPEDWGVYDVMKLDDCIDQVEKWKKDVWTELKETRQKMLDEKKKEDEEWRYWLSSMYARDYANLSHSEFCFETNVYNIELREVEVIPDDTEDYYAVMIDIHN